MTLYTNKSGKLNEVKEKPFKLEKDIQKVFEANHSSILGLELVKSEFTIKNKRIDTLAYDPQANAFIIIEYKRDKNMSLVDQDLPTSAKCLKTINYNFQESHNVNLTRNENVQCVIVLNLFLECF